MQSDDKERKAPTVIDDLPSQRVELYRLTHGGALPNEPYNEEHEQIMFHAHCDSYERGGNFGFVERRLFSEIYRLRAKLEEALSARSESPVTPEQFADVLKRIATRMGGHTIPVIHGPAWHNFMGLLKQVTPYECGIGPMPSEGNSPYVGEK